MRKSDQEFIRSLLFEVFEKDIEISKLKEELRTNNAYSADLYRQLTECEYKLQELTNENEALKRSVLHYANKSNELQVSLDLTKDLEFRISKLEQEVESSLTYDEDIVD